MSRLKVCVIMAIYCTVNANILAAAPFSFTAGHYYTTSGSSTSAVSQYDSSGQYVGALTVSGYGALCGIGFGPDGNLYLAAFDNQSSDDRMTVLAVNAAGQVQMTYPSALRASGASFKFDDQGHFYLGMLRFKIGDPASGETYLPHGYLGMDLLPGGGYLAADAYDLYELAPNRTVLREMNSAPPMSFTNLSGVAFDPDSNSIFATMMGHSDAFYQLMKIDYASGQLLGSVRAGSHPNDVFLTREGNLLVTGSGPAKVYTSDLVHLFDIGWGGSEYATQLVPEPGTASLTLALLALLGGVRIAATVRSRR